MGYNPQSDQLTGEQRATRLERDFQQMRAAGINTVFGWDPVEFDELTLEAAAQAGLGVAIPYDVDFNADFREGDVRHRATDQVLQLVSHHQGHPALRMWALGNELFQRSVPPNWCATPISDDDTQRGRALADWLIEAADAVHAADPRHPVLYREAEESYLPWLANALRERPASRPWLIYGMNAYTPRLGDILKVWPQLGLDAAVLVSEFALYSAPRGARAQGFRDLWATIRSQPDYVLGGAVYVWCTDGPETVDQAYGLVDRQGQPVDDALQAISEMYRAEPARR
jgi:beta-galactosidase/beta-glucuronidase